MCAYVVVGGGLFALLPVARVYLLILVHPSNLVRFLLLPKQLLIDLQAKGISKREQLQLRHGLRRRGHVAKHFAERSYLVDPSLQHRVIRKLLSILCFKDELVVELGERDARIAIELRRVCREVSRWAGAVVRVW